LASLPSLDELRGKLVGLIKAPAQQLASISIASANKLVNVFYARAKQ
jgi:large subunit ribosomal protein L10